jgi:phosphate-selective porin OprO and OprP
MALSTRLAAIAVLSLPLGTALAQSDTPPDTATLLKRIEEQDKRIEALERKLQSQQQAAAATPGTGPAAAPNAPTATAPTGAAVAGATQPQPSTAVEGATAAVSQSTAATNAAPGLSSPGTIKAGPSGFSFQSADGANVIRFRGNLAVDGRWFSDKSTPITADTFLFRKVRPYIEGTLDNIYDFRFMPDFGNGKTIIVDAFVTARLEPWLAIQAGKFKGPVGLERLQPDQYNRFMELGFPSSLVPNRDLGVQVGGDLLHGALGYAVGIFDGNTDGNSTDANASPDVDNDGKKDTEARLFAQPFLNSGIYALKGFGIGIGGTYVNSTGNAGNTLLASYKTPGQNTFFTYRTGATATFADGRRERWTPQAYYYVGSFGAIAEYAQSSQDVSRQLTTTVKRSGRIDNSAYQLSLSYFLTGETETYNSFTPLTTFHPGRPGWGAWEIVARYHELKIDSDAFTGGGNSFADPATAPRKARAVGVGVNWYLNQNVKWVLDFERTRFDGGAVSGDRPDEKALTTRFALTF